MLLASTLTASYLDVVQQLANVSQVTSQLASLQAGQLVSDIHCGTGLTLANVSWYLSYSNRALTQGATWETQVAETACIESPAPRQANAAAAGGVDHGADTRVRSG